MPNTPVFGWPYPALSNLADGPDLAEDLALAVEATLTDTSVQSYTPAWTSAGGAQPFIGPGDLRGRYRYRNGWVDLMVWMSFVSGSSGGAGRLAIGLPVTPGATIPEQAINVKTYLPSPGINFMGLGLISAGQSGASVMFPISRTDTSFGFWSSESSLGSGAGTGVPAVAGQFSVQIGGNLLMSGRYYAG